MAFKSGSICVICCERFRKGHQNNLKHSFHLQNLSFALSAVSVGGGATTSNNDKNLNSSCSSEMHDKLITAICPPCLVCVSSTLTKRDQINSLEEQVRKLQMKNLKLTSNLQAAVNAYKTEVNKMEGTVERGRDNIRNLDNFYCSGKEEDDGRERDLLKNAIQFREKVLTVFEDLRNLSNNLQVFSKPAASSTNSHHSAEVIINDTLLGDSMGKGKRSRKRRRVQVVCEEEEAEDVDLHDDNYFHNVKVEDSDVDKESTTDSWGNDNFEDASPRSQSSGENSGSEHSSDEEDEEFLPSTKTKRGKSVGGKTKRNRVRYPSREKAKDSGSLIETIDFSNMTSFKKNLIFRIFKKREKLQKAQTNRKNQQKKTPEELMFDKIDPRNFCFIDYDPSKSNTLTLRDINITIDEQEESLQCTECDFKCYQNKYRYPIECEYAMYDHVVGQHLKLYSCPHCPRDSFPSITKFRMHILSHNNHYACDICGKPLCDTNSLKHHKWLHLSDQEKEEAIKNGEKSPEEEYRRVKEAREKKHQCSTCGKSYFYPYDLRKHVENIHAPNRPQHKCSKCGKIFKTRDTLFSHSKYVCYPERGKVSVRFHCDLCPLTFPIQSKLNAHKSVTHSSEYLYSCSMCEKRFKSKGRVTQHERTHSDERPFLCSRGCGATFKDTSNRSRHEKKCGNYEEVTTTDNSNRPHMCFRCGKTFKRPDGLYGHQKYTCNDDEKIKKRFPCDQCSSAFAMQSKLNFHKLTVHSTELLYKCSTCEKMFKSKTSVRLHQRSHSDARPFSCRKGCGATYKDRSGLGRHEQKCGNG